MLVSMWMSRQVATVAPSTLVSDAVLLLARRGVRRVLVAETSPAGPRLVGIAATSDLARAYPPDVNPFSAGALGRRVNRQVADVMTRDVKTVAPDAPIDEAARILRMRKIGALPVVRDARILGIITAADVFRAFIEVAGVAGGDVRVTFDVAAGEDPVGVASELAGGQEARLLSVLTMEHDGRRLAVVRLHGGDSDRFVGAVWRSGHRVLAVENGHG